MAQFFFLKINTSYLILADATGRDGNPGLKPRNFSLARPAPPRGPADPPRAGADGPSGPRACRRRRPAAGAARSRRPRAGPARGERPESAPFLKDPNMASAAAARDDDTPPRRRRPRDRAGRRPESFASPLPARQGPADDQPGLHLPGQARAAATKVRLLLVPGAGRGLCRLPRPGLPGCVRRGTAQPARSGREGRAAGRRSRSQFFRRLEEWKEGWAPSPPPPNGPP
nr:uncharacterized protein LOC111774886 [Equus caballus]